MRVTRLFFISAFAIGMAGGVSSLQAADSVCKGLANAACTGNSVCSWVNPYKTKKGKEVAGFCRKKPVRTTAPKAPAAKAPAKSS